MIRVRILAVILLWILLVPARVFAQTADPCDQYKVGSPEYDQCRGLVTVAPSDTLAEQQNMVVIAGFGAVIVVIVLVVGSTVMMRRRMSNVPTSEMRDVLRALIPPEAGTVADEVLDRAARQLTTSSGRSDVRGQEWVVVVTFVVFAVFAVSYLLTGFSTLTQVIVAIMLLTFLVLAIRAVLVMARATKNVPEWMAVLGLKLISTPTIGLAPARGGFRTAIRGASVMGGTRYGREVTTVFATWVQVKLPVAQPFEVKGGDANWYTRPLPPGVVDALQKAAPLDRKMRVIGGADGIRVERQMNSMEMTSAKGTLRWLKDVQLAEAVADALR